MILQLSCCSKQQRTGDKCRNKHKEEAERNLNATYGYLKGVTKLMEMNFFLVAADKSQENRHKLRFRRFKLDSRKNVFTRKVMHHWNN